MLIILFHKEARLEINIVRESDDSVGESVTTPPIRVLHFRDNNNFEEL